MTVANQPLATVRKVLLCQLGLVLAVSLGIAVFMGLAAAKSSVLGGLAALLPNVVFGFWVIGSSGQAARRALNAFYVGESIKIALTVLLFVLIFQLPGIQVLPLLGCYIASQLVFWIALLMR